VDHNHGLIYISSNFELKNKFNRFLIVFFLQNLPMQFVLSKQMFEGTIGHLKVQGF